MIHMGHHHYPHPIHHHRLSSLKWWQLLPGDHLHGKTCISFLTDSQIKVFGLSSHDLQPWEIWSQEVHLHHKGESIAALCSKHHFCFICKNFLQHFFTPGPPALTFAVPLCILNGIFLPILVMTGEFYRTMDIGFPLSTPRTRMWLHRWYSSAPVTAYVRAYVRTSFLLTLTVLRSLMWY